MLRLVSAVITVFVVGIAATPAAAAPIITIVSGDGVLVDAAYDGTVDLNAVPEPAAVALFGLALAALAMRLRRGLGGT